MSVNQILNTNVNANNWKNITVKNIICESITGTSGIIADKIKTLSGNKAIDITADPLNNQALIYDSGTDKIKWVSLVDNTGITSLNGCSGLVQTFSKDDSPFDNSGFTILSNTLTNDHKFSIGDASTSSRGFISATTQSIAGAKTFINDIILGSTGSPSSIYVNNILSLSSGTTTMNITAPRVNINASDGLYVDNIKSVDYIYGHNNAYFEFLGVSDPPSIRAVSAYDWQLGASHSSNLNKQVSIGYSVTHDGALLYGYDQAGGVAKPFYIGFPGIPSSTYLSGFGYQNGNRPIVSGSSSGSGNMMYGAHIDNLGNISQSSGGISCSKTGTGIYRLTFDCSTVYGITASITQTGQLGYITPEVVGSAIYDIIIRNPTQIGVDLNFSIIAYAYKA